MKLPKCEEKFVVKEKWSYYFDRVVSGVFIEIRPDTVNPDSISYFVRCDKAYYGDDVIYGVYLCDSPSLERALEYIAQYLTPYQEQEEEIEKGSVVEEEDNEDAERFEQRCVYSYNFEIPNYDDVFSSGVCIGHSFFASFAISSITRSLGGVSFA